MDTESELRDHHDAAIARPEINTQSLDCPECGETYWRREESGIFSQVRGMDTATDPYTTIDDINNEVDDVTAWTCVQSHDAPQHIVEYLDSRL